MNTAGAPSLLFNWGPPRRRTRAIILFIGASLLLHIFCFYVFQIVYPQTAVLSPPPARVSFITNTSEEGRALLRWIEAEDPALPSSTQRPPESKTRALPKLEHVASYTNRQPTLKDLPPATVDLRAPSALPPGPAPTPGRTTAQSVAASETTVGFSEELEPMGSPKFPQTKFTAATREQPDSVRFRVAVSAHGEIRYAFRLNSSGDAALDQQAREHIALTRFPETSAAAPGSESLTWGIATVNWGNDIAHAGANATPAP